MGVVLWRMVSMLLSDSEFMLLMVWVVWVLRCGVMII